MINQLELYFRITKESTIDLIALSKGNTQAFDCLGLYQKVNNAVALLVGVRFARLKRLALCITPKVVTSPFLSMRLFFEDALFSPPRAGIIFINQLKARLNKK